MPTLVQRPPNAPKTTAGGRRRKGTNPWYVAMAFLAAFFLLGFLIVFLAWALPYYPRRIHKGASAPVTLTIEPSGPAATPGLHPTETVNQQPDYIRTPDDRKSDTPPPDPKFITDKDTQAAAEKPAEDMTKPLPSQDGREMTSYDFETNPYIPGQEAHDNLAMASQATQPAPTPPPANTPEPTPTPAPTPSPSLGEFALLKPESSPSNTPPEPSARPTPRSTPPPIKDALQAQADRVARENASYNSRSIQQPPGYQPQTTQTKMSGSVDNRGRSSVAALGTPLGRYEKAVSDAIGARWYFNVDQNMSTLVRTGEVKIHFVITRTGKIVNTRVIGRNENTALADISLEAITNAELPPIPSDVAATLPEGQLEVDYSFGLFGN